MQQLRLILWLPSRGSTKFTTADCANTWLLVASNGFSSALSGVRQRRVCYGLIRAGPEPRESTGLSFTLTTLMWSAGTESGPRWHASQSNNKNLRFGPWPQPSVFCPLVWFPLLYSWFTENPLLVLFSPINVTDYCDWYLRRTTTRQISEIYENVK